MTREKSLGKTTSRGRDLIERLGQNREANRNAKVTKKAKSSKTFSKMVRGEKGDSKIRGRNWGENWAKMEYEKPMENASGIPGKSWNHLEGVLGKTICVVKERAADRRQKSRAGTNVTHHPKKGQNEKPRLKKGEPCIKLEGSLKDSGRDQKYT